MKPQTREDFKKFCLRRLGAPVIQINLADEQIEDRIDEALELFSDYHYDGTEEVMYLYQVQQVDTTNLYITLPQQITGVKRVYPVNSQIATNSIFNIRYQIALNDLYSLTNVDMVPYFMAMQHIQLLEELLVGTPQWRFNQITEKLFLDVDWSMIVVGYYLLIDCYQAIDPTTNPKIWQNVWLQKYTTALIKENWGSVLTKFNNIQMPGGTSFNGQKIYDDAVAELEDLRQLLYNTYSNPIPVFIG